MSHTPGPWKAGTDNRVSGPTGNTVADCRYKNGDFDKLLVAAAPELLSSLKEAVGNLTVACLIMDGESRKLAMECIAEYKAVIAKAAGKGV